MKKQEIEKLEDEIEKLRLDVDEEQEMYQLDIEEANEKLEDNFHRIVQV